MVKAHNVDGAHRTFVRYIDRTREYYMAQGYERTYEWATFDEVPFARLSKPLAESRIALIITASPIREGHTPDDGLVEAKEVCSGQTDAPPARLYTADLAWDKESTHTDDVESFLPIRRLQKLVDAGRVGEVAPRYHCVPTEYSQRRTQEQDAPEILRRCRQDDADAALLVPL